MFFFFNDTATTEIYTLSLHDALPILTIHRIYNGWFFVGRPTLEELRHDLREIMRSRDRKSTRLNSSHANISYAVFCLKKKNKNLSTFSCLSRVHDVY